MSLAALGAGLRGSLLTAGPALDAHSWDFSAALRRRPRAVVRAAGPEDADATFAFAREHGIPVTIRAGGNSGHGQSLGEGIVLLPARADAPARLLPDGSAELDPVSPWQAVDRFLAAHGRAAPVLPALLRTTVGGTLAVGGYGVRSLARGNQLDHVERARILRPDGSRVWCSRSERADLFGLALGSLGQLGLVDRVTMRTVPRRLTSVFRREFGGFGELAAWLADPPAADSFFSFSGKPELRRSAVAALVGLDAGAAAPRPAGAVPIAAGRDFDASVDQDVRAWLAAQGNDARLFTDVVVDHAGLTELAGWLDGGAARAEPLRGVYVLAARNSARFPFDGRHGDADLAYGLGLYAFAPRAGGPPRARAEGLLRELVERALALGGRPFLWGWQRLSERDLEAVYGASYASLRRARLAADPGELLNRGSLNGPP